MQISNIFLRSFRNYQDFICHFSPGVNLISGENAQGKTNLLEAVHYLSCGSAFRTRKEAELVRFGEEFADMEAEVCSYGRDVRLRAVLFADRRQRQLFLGGVRQKTAASMRGILTTVLFCPEDLMVLKTGAAPRRKLINDGLSQLRPRYEQALSEYNRILLQKSRILHDYKENPGLLSVLPEYNERMAQFGAVIISYRAKYIRELSRLAAGYHGSFSGSLEELSLQYRTVSNILNPFAPPEQLYSLLREHQESHRAAELSSMQCLSGPHRDDFDALLNGLSIHDFASQGQTRTAAISIKLAERELLRLDTGEEPVLLLDDVLSELDARRQDFLLNHICSGQILITSCETEHLPESGNHIRIHGGKIIENQE